MATAALTITVDASGLEAAAKQIRHIHDSLPFDSRQRFAESVLGLIDSGALKVGKLGSSSASGAGNDVVRLGVFGFEELIAAARCAAEGNI